jgi:AbrB family looped-hinge helix DNA binding protein
LAKHVKDFEHRFYDVATVGERGQVVIPSEARKALGIKAGDKLIALEGPMGSSIVFFKMRSMNSFMQKVMGTLSRTKGIGSK